ncbi:MAG TPA: glycosyltransferase 87 family protein [Polyangia bacterium]|jgi:hypothetical protein
MNRPLGSERLRDLALLASSALMFLSFHFIFALFHRYDWGQPFVKLACFETLVLLIVAVGFNRGGAGAEGSRVEVSIELVAASALLAWELVRAAQLFGHGLDTGMNDLGETTEHAARLLFVEHKNPFREVVAPIGNDPAYFGYKYGPTMIFAYALAGFVGHGVGLKVTNAIYLLATCGVVAYLAGWTKRDEGTPPPRPQARAAAAIWACALSLLPERLYHETFNQGAQDVFVIFLVLLSAAFVARKQWLLAGLVASLSFSARFAPGAFLLVLFLRRRIPPRLIVGGALGMLPFVPFLLWDAPAVVRNVFLFHSFKAYDSTSLYSVTPPELHWLFSAFQAAAVIVIVALSFRRAIEARPLVVFVTLLLIAIEISYREMHGNHLIWFMPTVAVIFAWGRHELPRFWGCKRSPDGAVSR